MTRVRFVSAAGNRFALVDGFAQPPPADPAGLARVLRDPAAWAGAGPPWPLDGLLLVRPPGPTEPGGEPADCAMEVYNLDGGRPEACGNGLRCVARHVAERGAGALGAGSLGAGSLGAGSLGAGGGAGSGRARVRVATDAGPRTVELARAGAAVVARAWMGVPAVHAERVPLAPAGAPGPALEGVALSLGNPHCVVLVADERVLPLEAWGAALQRDPRFPDGVNLELVSLRAPGRLAVRVFERGVGETDACGTGACAAALAVELRGLRPLPARVAMRGGELAVGRAPDGGLTLAGPVTDAGAGVLRAPAAEDAAAPGDASGARSGA